MLSFYDFNFPINNLLFVSIDSLVQYFQQFYDGHISCWFSFNDINENFKKRLRKI